MSQERARIIVRGAVQGVGFRPFIHRIAIEDELRGFVLNSSAGVIIEVEGERASLQRFVSRIQNEKPPLAVLLSMDTSFLCPIAHTRFEIRESEIAGEKTALILPDIATCNNCVREILDPANRRFHYPFTNCTNCGPRFSIIEALPYDRANTSMKKFTMCAECEREYHDPRDRRFHAQPNACPQCGPQLQLWNSSGEVVSECDETLGRATEEIRAGKILALKGIGGFQLMFDARNQAAVRRLRERKHREEKPFAFMSPSLEAAREHCEISDLEERLLLSPECPIVLLRKKSAISNQQSAIASSVAPHNPNLGVMLPYTPLHHLLMRALDFPVVATSGNLSDEPICIDEGEALVRLGALADFFLVHDRPIVRHVDDSIMRVMAGREIMLRRARGFAPLPITLREDFPPMLALGAHLKNTVALSVGRNVFVSQHIGDLQTKEAYAAFCTVAADLPRLYESQVETVVCDLHPDYLSTKYAAQSGLPNEFVQHHWAHVAACMAENEIEPPLLGVSWDGTGYGTDGTIWGGEFLRARADGFTRVAHLRQFRLPGGDAAIKEPRRSALGLLYQIFGEDLWGREELLRDFSTAEIKVLRQMFLRKTHAPLTSSAGRLFDGVAALLGLRKSASFEGQAAMDLEFAICPETTDSYPFEMENTSPVIVDWRPAIAAIIGDAQRHESVAAISAKFHNMMCEVIVAVARRSGERKVALSGGCFQNRYLTEHAIDRLRAENFQPYWHQRIPPNDGGISLGQIAAAQWRRTEAQG